MAEWSDRYEYNVANVASIVSDSGGVYSLSYQQNNKDNVFYVGQTTNLKIGLQQQLNPSEPDSCIKEHLQKYDCCFRFSKIDSDDERTRVEKVEVEKHKPICNE